MAEDLASLRALARRELGRVSAWLHQDEIAAVPDLLVAGERVEAVAVVDEVVAVVTSGRLLVLAASPDKDTLRWQIDRSAIRSVTTQGDDIVVHADTPHTLDSDSAGHSPRCAVRSSPAPASSWRQTRRSSALPSRWKG